MSRLRKSRHSKKKSFWSATAYWPGKTVKATSGDESAQLSLGLAAELLRTGLFDEKWYLETYADVAAAKVDPIRHYFDVGAGEGRFPNPLFDTKWYVNRYPDVGARVNPLAHYMLYGEREGRSPNPHFETKWYRQEYRAEIGSDYALVHYLRNRGKKVYSPNSVFDPKYYLEQNSDVASAGIDPFEHFIKTGFREGRSPSKGFDVVYYRRKYLRHDTRDPIAHYLEVGRAAGLPTNPSSTPTQADEIRRFSASGPNFQEIDLRAVASLPKRAKAIAFHLTQFHSIPENDRWWGKGFTEWTNIMRGTPRFAGHYQPRIPRDFGFYDLTGPGHLKRQVDLAKQAGLYGFCFYYYNFGGKRLLERPLDELLKNTEIEFPFCLMWANENWTRRWDGGENEIIMRQDYNRDGIILLVDDLARHFRDSRYIRIAGRPLSFVYRADVIPEPRVTIEQLRQLFWERHGEEPWIFMAQTFANTDPWLFGLDGSVEFPPHKLLRNIPPKEPSLIFDDRFSACVYDYDDLVESSLSVGVPPFPLFKTVLPSWDNDARRQGHGVTIRDSTPAKYFKWLGAAIDFARENRFHGEALVFINAWNEWAEGAYLEPDVHFGAAYLNSTARALVGVPVSLGNRKVLLVADGGFSTGSQMSFLRLADTIRNQFGFDLQILVGNSDDLLQACQSIAPTALVQDGIDSELTIQRLVEQGYRYVLNWSLTSAHVVAQLSGHGCRIISLVHEPPGTVIERNLVAGAQIIAESADELVFATASIGDAFSTLIGGINSKVRVRPPGCHREVSRIDRARDEVYRELGLPEGAKLAISIGHGHLRKGVDLICTAALSLAERKPEIHFVWIGGLDPVVKSWIAGTSAPPNVHFLGERQDVARFLSAADVFVLPSREDAYSCAALEALAAGLPLVAFSGAGGIAELLSERPDLGSLVPNFDPFALGREIVRILDDEAICNVVCARKRAQFVAERFAFDDYAFDLVQRLEPGTKRVSVIVPNYNYVRYLLERLTSIFGQSYPVFEIIVLDDCSSDGSLERLEEIAAAAKRIIKIVLNESNSGNVFAQWAKGAAMARGDLVWIAEADDISDRHFLEELVRFFENDETIFAFSDSSAIDADGGVQFDSYKGYYARSGQDALAADLIEDARSFAAAYLAERNLILNVSSVLWRRDCLLRALKWGERELGDYRLAGDWFLYLCACAAGGKVGYCAKTLNLHRRHESGVTSRFAGEQLRVVSRVFRKFAFG